jgi:hypothetical protein
MLAAMELAGNQTVINAVSLRILQYSEDLCKFERLEATVLTGGFRDVCLQQSSPYASKALFCSGGKAIIGLLAKPVGTRRKMEVKRVG